MCMFPVFFPASRVDIFPPGLGNRGYEALNFAIFQDHNVVRCLLDKGHTRTRPYGISEIGYGLQIAGGRGDLEMFELPEEYGFEVRSSTLSKQRKRTVYHWSNFWWITRRLISMPQALDFRCRLFNSQQNMAILR